MSSHDRTGKAQDFPSRSPYKNTGTRSFHLRQGWLKPVRRPGSISRTINLFETITLLAIMMTLAAVPSASVALVVTRSATLGAANGFAVAGGIVLGDLLFILLSILGLSVIAESMSALFVVIRYLGAAYLLWLGCFLIREKSKPDNNADKRRENGGLLASVLGGFFLTLGDITALFFYLSLLPMFLDWSTLRFPDLLIILTVTVFSVGSVKVFYALSAAKIASLFSGRRFENAVRKTAGGLIAGAGSWMMVKS